MWRSFHELGFTTTNALIGTNANASDTCTLYKEDNENHLTFKHIELDTFADSVLDVHLQSMKKEHQVLSEMMLS